MEKDYSQYLLPDGHDTQHNNIQYNDTPQHNNT